jgi:hypothetical protein
MGIHNMTGIAKAGLARDNNRAAADYSDYNNHQKYLCSPVQLPEYINP